ncbi:hypothetical protein [Arthrobacter sp. UYCu723]
MTLRSLSWRIHTLGEEIVALDTQLDPRVAQPAPALLSRLGIGPGHATQFFVTAGQNPDRLGSEAALPHSAGLLPFLSFQGRHTGCASAAAVTQANRALHLMAVCRLRYDPRTIDYLARRTADGLSKKDVLRCPKRFTAREVFNDDRSHHRLTIYRA